LPFKKIAIGRARKNKDASEGKKWAFLLVFFSIPHKNYDDEQKAKRKMKKSIIF
jgi:hypothetical protein